MTYERFEDLPVWNSAIELGRAVYAFTARPAFKGQGSLRDQLERAAVSVSNNIAEGFERGTTQELITFLYYARGSAGEVRSMLSLIEGISGFRDLRSEISGVKSLVESCSRQLRAWRNRCRILKSAEHVTSMRACGDATTRKSARWLFNPTWSESPPLRGGSRRKSDEAHNADFRIQISRSW